MGAIAFGADGDSRVQRIAQSVDRLPVFGPRILGARIPVGFALQLDALAIVVCKVRPTVSIGGRMRARDRGGWDKEMS